REGGRSEALGPKGAGSERGRRTAPGPGDRSVGTGEQEDRPVCPEGTARRGLCKGPRQASDNPGGPRVAASPPPTRGGRVAEREGLLQRTGRRGRAFNRRGELRGHDRLRRWGRDRERRRISPDR